MTIPTVTVTGSFEDGEGNPATGTVTFKLNTVLTDATDDTVVSRTPIVATLSGGTFTQALAATSGGDIQPSSGVVYTVTENITGTRARRYRVALPSDNPVVNLADLSPADSTGLVWDQPISATMSVPTDKTADYTLVLSDHLASIGVDSATAKNVTVPPNSSVAFPVGSLVEVRQVGAGQVTLVPGSGVTLRSAGSALKLRTQYSAASLLKIASDIWSVQGDLVAS